MGQRCQQYRTNKTQTIFITLPFIKVSVNFFQFLTRRKFNWESETKLQSHCTIILEKINYFFCLFSRFQFNFVSYIISFRQRSFRMQHEMGRQLIFLFVFENRRSRRFCYKIGKKLWAMILSVRFLKLFDLEVEFHE